MILSVANRKGGAGKTTTAHALAVGMTKYVNVLLIDLDGQENLSFSNGVKTEGPDIMEVLTGNASIKDAIVNGPKYDILPASESLAAADKILANEFHLKKALEGLHHYETIIIDTPPALGSLSVNALTASDAVFITAQPEIYSFHGAVKLYETIQTIRKRSNPDLDLLGFILTRYAGRTTLAQAMLENFEELAKKDNAKMGVFTIRECNAVKEAQFFQKDIFDYAPKCNAAADYNVIIERLGDLWGHYLLPPSKRK